MTAFDEDSATRAMVERLLSLQRYAGISVYECLRSRVGGALTGNSGPVLRLALRKVDGQIVCKEYKLSRLRRGDELLQGILWLADGAAGIKRDPVAATEGAFMVLQTDSDKSIRAPQSADLDAQLDLMTDSDLRALAREALVLLGGRS